ncbi:hypothetical protein SK128_009929 [Halocaridina rubra]|uniref:3-hydroxyacyl-CoA dehydrogenase NAD binding domain-containing protein n=1 Tax=Halocaridina rubra TaxID=373956 RepID=A0AAN8WYE2_HALRR
MAFFNQLTRRSLSQSAVMSAVIKNVTVIGSGLMGAGIAQVAAQSGHKVTMVDLDKEIVKKAEQKISASVQKAAKKKFGDNNDDAVKFTSEVLERLSTSTDAVAAVKGADLVIEAIVENLDAKKTLFVQLDPPSSNPSWKKSKDYKAGGSSRRSYSEETKQDIEKSNTVAPQHTIFASNTSALSITEISEATQRKDRFGGLHFFNPVPIMKLLEVITFRRVYEET